MNFFTAQDQARRVSRRLVFAYLFATAIIVLGVTAVVGFALYSVTDSSYGLGLADSLAQQAPILTATALGTTLPSRWFSGMISAPWTCSFR